MEEPKDRLGEGAAPFRLWLHEELPSIWRQHLTDDHICVSVELPGSPWERAYYKGASKQLEALPESADAVPVMLTNMADF